MTKIASRYARLTFGWADASKVHIFADGPFCLCRMPKSALTEQSHGFWPETRHKSDLCEACNKLEKFLASDKGGAIRKPAAIKRDEDRRTRQFSKRRQSELKKSRSDVLPDAVWQKLRYEALKNSKGQCVLCGHGRRENAVLHVDHIKPVSKFPELAQDPSNLQVLCRPCNMGKSNRDSIDWKSK